MLVVAIDADTKTCTERKERLHKSCEVASVEPRQETDKLMLFIPKRNIETWIKFYDGKSVDEEHDYAHFLNGHESDCYPAADKMSEEFSTGAVSAVLPSLHDAYTDYAHLAALLEA